MQLLRVRFTVRLLMLLVVVVALLLAGEATRRRWESLASAYRTKAGGCEHRALLARHSYQAALGNDPDDRKFKRIEDHYVALARKYQHAARRPWLPVAPDPPEPN